MRQKDTAAQPGPPSSRLRAGAKAPAALVCLTLLAAVVGAAAAPGISRAAQEHTFALEMNGSNTPKGSFDDPCGTTVDDYGNLYVASGAAGITGEGTGGRIDVFDPAGNFITEVLDSKVPCSVDVDAAGNLYVQHYVSPKHTVVYRPTTYEPAAGKIAYDPTPEDFVPAAELLGSQAYGVAVDRSDGNVFVTSGTIAVRKPDGSLEKRDETQGLGVDATGGVFNLALPYEEVESSGAIRFDFNPQSRGYGTLSAGSTAVTKVTKTNGGPFAVGQTIVGLGIPDATKIAAVGEGTLTLSKPALGSMPVNLAAGTPTSLQKTGAAGIGDLTAGSPEVSLHPLASGTGKITEGEPNVGSVSTSSGAFEAGQYIHGPGIPADTKIVEIRSFGELKLSNPATATAEGVSISAQAPFAVDQGVAGEGIPAGTKIAAVGEESLTLTASATATKAATPVTSGIPYDASAAEVQAALEGLPGLEGGFSVSGGPGGSGTPYSIAFQGKLGQRDAIQLEADSSALTGAGHSAVVQTTSQGFDGYVGDGATRGFDTSSASLNGIWSADVRESSGDVYALGATRVPKAPVGSLDSPRAFVFDSEFQLERVVVGGAPSEAIAVDQSNGDLFLGNVEAEKAVEQLDSAGNLIGKLEHSLKQPNPYADVAVDSSGGPRDGYVYVTSGSTAAAGRVYAFAPVITHEPPEVQGLAASQVGENAARLEAEVNPHNNATSYRFEYTTLARYEAEGFEGAIRVPVPDGQAGSGGVFAKVSEPLGGLSAGQSYRFRVVAESHCDPGDPEEVCVAVSEGVSFATYPPEEGSATCPNAAQRIGPSASLPDCRAYELVTPPDTNGRVPTSAFFGTRGTTSSGAFPVALAAAGELLFGAEGGTLPGQQGTGFYDSYLARRGPSGWSTSSTAIAGEEAPTAFPGGVDAEHAYAFWQIGSTGTEGSLVFGGKYLRAADGAIEPIGLGSLATDLEATGYFISPGGGHVTFGSEDHLEPAAPPAGTKALYDRRPGSSGELVSLLPGDVTPSTAATYRGSSADGSAVAFSVAGALYVRRGGRTVEVAAATDNPTFAGLSADGSRAFYLITEEEEEANGGEATMCELAAGGCAGAEAHAPVAIGSGGESIFADVSADGSHAYFISPLALTGGQVNSFGASAQAGQPNLYAWHDGTLSFIATVTPEDVEGELIYGELVGQHAHGLGLWTDQATRNNYYRAGGPANLGTRTNRSGRVLAFESRANLDPAYESAGHREVFRYDDASGSLACVSCNPTLAVATSDASLQSLSTKEFASLPPLNAITPVANVSAGGAVFFQSDEALSIKDVDRRTDVYEWKDGRVSLLSSGHSFTAEHLYGVSADGADVFFLSGDILLAADTSGTPSIYDARVNGGFPAPEGEASCAGDECQGELTSPPASRPAASAALHGAGNFAPRARKRCRRGTRRVRRAGKVRCVKRRHRRRHRSHRRAHRRHHKAAQRNGNVRRGR